MQQPLFEPRRRSQPVVRVDAHGRRRTAPVVRPESARAVIDADIIARHTETPVQRHHELAHPAADVSQGTLSASITPGFTLKVDRDSRTITGFDVVGLNGDAMCDGRPSAWRLDVPGQVTFLDVTEWRTNKPAVSGWYRTRDLDSVADDNDTREQRRFFTSAGLWLGPVRVGDDEDIVLWATRVIDPCQDDIQWCGLLAPAQYEYQLILVPPYVR